MTAAFIKRDLRHLAPKVHFLLVQAALSACGAYLLLSLDKITFVLGFAYVCAACFFNSTFIQELFLLDSMFTSQYKKMPLRFGSFIKARLACELVYAIWAPALFVMAGLFLNKLGFIDFMILLAASTFGLSYLCLYVSSVILIYFPDVKRTTFPLLISFFLFAAPYLTPAVVWFGLRKGKKAWRLWADNA
jgi:hypothetical protein